jgi:hypothetical protein
MLRITSCPVAAWFLLAPLTAAAATPLQPAPSDGSATVTIAEQSAQRIAQNAVRPQPPAARQSPQAQGQPQGPPQVYLLRGFLNVFSLGMDDLAGKLQADGIAATVANHADADYIASRILTTYNSGSRGPIVLIGHSLGADAICEVANTLARYNVPIALLVLFDGTEPHQIPANVTTAINYTKHFMIAPAPSSRGTVSNVDLSGDPGIDHLSIDTAPSLQAQVRNYVLQAAAPAPPRAPVQRRQ